MPANDPAWSDKTVFNDRMHQIHSGILSLHTAFTGCPSFMKDKASLGAWRNYMLNWSAFYKAVGSKEYFDPNESQIANAKVYASQLGKWIAYLQSIKDCASRVPTVPSQVNAEAPPSPNATPALPAWALQLAGIATAGGLLLILANKHT
jgi:hypothetical protein